MYDGGELAYFIFLFAVAIYMYCKAFKNRTKYKEDKDKIKVVDLCTDLIDMKSIEVDENFKPIDKRLKNELAIIKSYQSLIDNKEHDYLNEIDVKNRIDMLPDFLLFAGAYMLKCYRYKRKDLADKLMSRISFSEEEIKWVDYGLLKCIYDNLKEVSNKCYQSITDGDYLLRDPNYILFVKQLNMVFMKSAGLTLDEVGISEYESSKNTRWVKFLEAE